MRISYAIGVALAFTSPAAAENVKPLVKTRAGSVQGVSEGASIAYRGIPFAQPPVGNLRWRAPLPAKSWRRPRAANQFGPDCIQLPIVTDAAPVGAGPSEDCLYLNIWTPANRSEKKRPVMVWIYGGGFVNGGSSSPIYTGRAFAESDVVFVSFNYRLGRFGFFAHPALKREAAGTPTGNFAILDQIAALKWVQDNISAFGGDPRNVTIFGESAGGMSVQALTTTPLAKGLFDKAIVMSGGGRDLMGTPKTAVEAEAVGAEFARTKGIMGDDASALSNLRALPADAVIGGLSLRSLFAAKNFTPLYVDGQIVRQPVDAAYAAGDGAKISMMIGANDADGFFFGGGLDQAYAPVAAMRAIAEKIYDPAGRKDAIRIGVAVSADTLFLEPARHISRIITARGQNVYSYRFAYVPEYLRAKLPGAPHASELPFVFDTVDVRYGPVATLADRSAAKLLHSYWVNFAKTGVPSTQGGATWSRYRAEADNVMIFDAAGAKERPDPIRSRLDFVEQAIKVK